MSVTGRKGIGIPIILLHDSEGSMVTIELKNGSVYRGILEEAQDEQNKRAQSKKLQSQATVATT